jgi:hypothetical protein
VRGALAPASTPKENPLGRGRTGNEADGIATSPDADARISDGMPAGLQLSRRNLRNRVALASLLAVDDDNDPGAPGIRRPGLG